MRYAPNILLSSLFLTGALALAIPARADFMNDAQRFLNQGGQSDQNAYEQGRRDEMRRQQAEREQRRAMREQQYGQQYRRDDYGDRRYSDRYDDHYNERRY